MNIDILQIIFGIVLGLFLGPLIAFALAYLGYLARGKQVDSKIEDLKYEHKKQITAYKKQYDKTKHKYLKLREKLVGLVDQIPEKIDDTTAEA